MDFANDEKQLAPFKSDHLNQADECLLPKPRGMHSRRQWPWLVLPILFPSCAALFWLYSYCFIAGHVNEHELMLVSLEPATKVARAAAATSSTATPLLEDFQVYQPVFFPSGAVDDTATSESQDTVATIDSATSSGSSCQVLLMEHSFGFSFGIPFVGDYTPPACKFNRVVMNFTVTSSGRQFDRLALMYFNDTEVWRTSTAEPTATGIRWEYNKDMTEYLYFWNSPQKLIFDLANLIDSTFTGFYNTTLTATFFEEQETVEPASLIIPISARLGNTNSASVFMIPSANASNTISFPQNANRAVFSVSACGQATEEFWWSNVLQSNIDTFEPADGTLFGFSPFREVQILIDGQLAGVHWPFPVIFTGGVVPGFWRPIVGIDAFDLREHEIDITPWLGTLSDGNQHTFEIRVAGLLDDGQNSATITESVGDSWYVTGKIFVWQDDATSITTGMAPTILLPAPSISVSQKLTQDATGANETLKYTANVQRSLTISSLLTTKSGTNLVTWTQSLSAQNFGLLTDYGITQINNQTTTGTDSSTGGTFYKASYSYPLYANSTFIEDASGDLFITAELIRGNNIAILGTPVFPTGLQPFAQLPAAAALVAGFSGSSLQTTQNGSAQYFANGTTGTSSSFGSTSQVFSFGGVSADGAVADVELYFRSVEAVNTTIVSDTERLVGAEVPRFAAPAAAPVQSEVGLMSPKEAIGRGSGTPRQSLVQSGGGK